METIALVMAGGRGERMRSSGRPVAKPLVAVRGVPLLERNLTAVLRAGLTDIVVSVPAGIPEIGSFVRTRASALAGAAGARVEVLEEARPLGNIGCAGLLKDRADDVLVVYADNLTSLDLRTVLAHHRGSGAGLTLSTHVEPYHLPYGELTVDGGRVVEYREKPEHRMLICSAVSVLGPAALEVAAAEAPLGLVDLFRALTSRGETVADFRHDAPWVDVNDAAAVDRATEMVAAAAADFECWWDPPATTETFALVRGDDGVLVRGGDDARTGLPLDLPSRDEVASLALTEPAGPAAFEFDDLDDRTGLLVRHRVLRVDAPAGSHPAPEGTRWVSAEELGTGDDPGSITSRLARAWAATATGAEGGRHAG